MKKHRGTYLDSNFTRGEAVETNEIINRLNTIFREVFDDDTINVNPKMVASDVAQWDSLGNIRLMISIEEAFGISFDTDEIAGSADVGELIQAISDKVKK